MRILGHKEVASTNVGDILHVQGKTGLTIGGVEQYLQIIILGGRVEFLNIETGHCVSNTLDISVRDVSTVASMVKKKWTGWKLLEVINGAECEVMLPPKK